MKNKLIFLVIPLLITFSGFGQNKPSVWVELGFSKELMKNLKLEFNPELRLQDAFDVDSTKGFKMDSYILEGGLSYKLHKYLTVASYYRFEEEYKAKYKKKRDEYIYSNKSSNRIAFDLKSGVDIERFSLQFRLRYTQGLYVNNDASEFRFRTKVDYDIKGSKFIPFASVEVFNDQSILAADRELISGSIKAIDKVRYTAGVSYTINKNNEATLFYRIQDSRIKNEINNILGLGYSHDF
jgi:hypothetical protein